MTDGDGFGSREAIIRSVALEQGVDAELILNLLALEEEHSNLHAYGARARLRRAAEELIDDAYEKANSAAR